ncbi:MAG TPA: hypothetical protein VGD91_18235 [Trebonia sp.]
MAVAAFLLWLGTVAVGTYLLVSAISAGNAARANRAGAETPAAVPVPVPARPLSARDRFDPPSLQRAKAESMPGLRDLAEFAHPALAITGLAFWLFYVISRDRVFAAIGLGILLGAIGAGISWFAVNRREARRQAADGSGSGGHAAPELSFTPRLLVLHAIGAALTLLFTVLIVARV